MSTGVRASEICREEENATSAAQELDWRLRQFTEEHAGPMDEKPLVLSIRNDNNELVAGLRGIFLWNVLFIDVLWVDVMHRRKGHGTSLLRFAEREASERGLDIVYLGTFDFQAPAFYLKQGYNLIGELSGAPRGFKHQWFAKHVGTREQGPSAVR